MPDHTIVYQKTHQKWILVGKGVGRSSGARGGSGVGMVGFKGICFVPKLLPMYGTYRALITLWR